MAYRASSSGNASYTDDDDSSPAGGGGGSNGSRTHTAPNDGRAGSAAGAAPGNGGGAGRLSADLRDKPLYLLEHLATFTVDKSAGIQLPADGIRRLLQLEKTTGIWSQKMQLCLDREWVLIVDFESGNVIERFAATMIMEPTAFTSTSPMDMYNNVLVFIVGGGAGTRSEMHIFQSQSTSAIQIVEDLKQVRSGKPIQSAPTGHQQQRSSATPVGAHHSNMSSPKHHPHAGQQPTNTAQQHRKSTASAISNFLPNYDTQATVTDADASSELSLIIGRHSDRSRSRSRARAQHHQNQHQPHPHHQHHQHQQQHHDDISSTSSSEKYERDVCVLNHCFDDIEKFIARLQHAAAASRELERRQHARKSKKKSLGEGLLTLRTKPPYEKEFVDIFAKFKLSFNLLAKLKSHIHDPNAPELIHFLFTPLALIVDASHDAYYAPNISGRTVDPLLTREAVNLLCNCVTSKETELWRSLGETWTVPRDQWKGHVGSYHPVFFDGWSPDYPVIDDLDDELLLQVAPAVVSARGLAAAAHLAKRRPSPMAEQLQQQQHHHQQQYLSEYEYDPKFVPSSASPSAIGGGGGQREFSTTRSELSVDSMVMMERNMLPSTANAGGGHAMMMTAAMAQHWLESVHDRGGKVVQTTHPRTANNDKELTVMRGEYLEVLDDSRKWWKCGNARGQVGHVPHTIIIPWQFSEAGAAATQLIPKMGRSSGKVSR